ncbi:MAG: hypothetical protein QOK02_4783 [Mycobacterium sp.]|jgi:hypothetical protein|nr:hypothetical protein [Mycobacterium sp.]
MWLGVVSAGGADDSARITLAESPLASSYGTESTVGDHDPATSDTPAVLSIGLHPSAIDYGLHPGLDETTMTARVDAGDAALRAAGFDLIACRVPASPDDAEAVVRDRAGSRPFGVVMIGAGVRMTPEHTELFERLVNVVNEVAPGVSFCFNTSPESTIDALRRWVTPTQVPR